MKRISHTFRSKDKLLHIETDLGIINIRVGLEDTEGRRVESVEILPNRSVDESLVLLEGCTNTRLVEVKEN